MRARFNKRQPHNIASFHLVLFLSLSLSRLVVRPAIPQELGSREQEYFQESKEQRKNGAKLGEDRIQIARALNLSATTASRLTSD